MTDAELLSEMYERNYLSGEIFRSIYGNGYREHFDAYKKSRALPAHVREACIRFLNGCRPLAESIAHSQPE
jgi:hypothetical protein